MDAAENNVLPDGTVFESWERPRRWKRTYHVAQNSPGACDDNDGSARRPWLTIGQAAAILQPGQRVIVHEGVYREWVRPARGGTGPARMIGYEAAAGETVVITGSDLWRPRWEPTKDYFFIQPDVFPLTPKRKAPRTWRAPLSGSMFEGANVFGLSNWSVPPVTEGHPYNLLSGYELRRGQLFLEGRPLRQVNSYAALETQEDAFWVEENGMAVHLRLSGDRSPRGRTFEITTREQVFAPARRFLSYLRLAGFVIRHAGNGIPIGPPQRGAVSAANGHHWIIEDCHISHANTLGVDLGCGFWTHTPAPRRQGHHILRRNHIHNCGLCGIAAWLDRPNQDLLIEDNLIEDIGGLRVGGHYESAGVKIHYAVNSLLRRNVIRRCEGCSCLWLDGVTTNVRVTQNVFHGAIGTPWGAVCVEISHGPVLVDNNIVHHTQNHGLYEHDSARVLAVQNLVANGGGPAVHFRLGNPARKDFMHAHPEGHHRIYANVLAGYNAYVAADGGDIACDFNVLGGFRPADRWGMFGRGQDEKYESLAAWRKLGFDRHSLETPLTVRFDPDRLELSVTADGVQGLPRIESLPPLLRWIPTGKELFGRYRRSRGVRVGRRVAPPEVLFQADLLGRANPAAGFRVGPLAGLPLDGTPIPVDPRRR